MNAVIDELLKTRKPKVVETNPEAHHVALKQEDHDSSYPNAKQRAKHNLPKPQHIPTPRRKSPYQRRRANEKVA